MTALSLRKIVSLTLVLAVVTGCATTRMGSMPKWNLAWWKKHDTSSTRRDDAIAAPSQTMSPLNSLVKSESKPTAERPLRKPYTVPGEPPESRSFAASDSAKSGAADRSGDLTPDRKQLPILGPIIRPNSNNSSPDSVAKSNMPGTSQNTLGKMGDSPRKAFELSPAMPMDEPPGSTTGSHDAPTTSTAMESRATSDPTAKSSDSSARRIVNPYADYAATNAAAEDGRTATASNIETTPTYTSTPYGSFSPKAPVATVSASGNLPDLNSQMLRPMATPNASTSQSNGANSTFASGKTDSSMLLHANASARYAPGSTQGSQSLTDLLGSDPTAENTAAAPPTIGGGGSFKIQ